MKNEKTIGIGGGVGPMAGVELQRHIIQQTEAGGTDQGHLEVLHSSRSHDIEDRTKFLLEKGRKNPAEGMFRTVKAMEKAAKKASKMEGGKKDLVVGVPCNTFHAPKIFQEFLRLLKEDGSKAQVLNMLEETGDLIKKILPEANKIGLMSTTGTREVGVYHEILEPRGFAITEVPEELQAELHDTIYNPEWGIKAVNPVSEKARENFLRYVQILKDQGAEAVILGCTEIPLALPEKEIDKTPLIDPMFALARALVREANQKKLKAV